MLDEAYAITTEAQNDYRRTMEAFVTLTRFELIYNYIYRIILPSFGLIHF